MPDPGQMHGGITGAEIAWRIIAFTNLFTHGGVGRVCDDDNPFFAEAIARHHQGLRRAPRRPDDTGADTTRRSVEVGR